MEFRNTARAVEDAEVIAGRGGFDVGVRFGEGCVALLLIPRTGGDGEELAVGELTAENARRLAVELEMVAECLDRELALRRGAPPRSLVPARRRSAANGHRR